MHLTLLCRVDQFHPTMTSNLLTTNLVPPRPKEKARYTIRELLILGLTLPIRFCPLNKFGPEALGLEIVSLERINASMMHYEREQMRQWKVAQQDARKKLHELAKARGERERRQTTRVIHRDATESYSSSKLAVPQPQILRLMSTETGAWYLSDEFKSLSKD